MAHDSERCQALSVELVKAARDFDREPGTINRVDMMDAIMPITQRLVEVGVPAGVVVEVLRTCADAVEGIHRHIAEREAEAKRPKLRLVDDDT